jgi:hypothetical protein
MLNGIGCSGTNFENNEQRQEDTGVILYSVNDPALLHGSERLSAD